ncbi:MAG: spore maturation protein [Clostridia bacterium]|nr:spore maturation protein [Clostridia bacterium]MBQ6859082.1 spore maturation protein [Clostridia bacterium]
MADSSVILPSLVVLVVLTGMRARIDVYSAFVRGAKEGLITLLHMAPYLCAILSASSLLRETGVLDALCGFLAPVLSLLGLPREIAPIALLRPLSGSAALSLVASVLEACGPDSRAGRLACVVCGANETILFTGALYMGAAGVKSARYALPVSLAAYAAGLAAAGFLV